jgi:ABC-type transport system involved in multi-copper enzyme maturation permease subunit
MARQLGLGPVFVYEWITASRRWQMYAVRSLFVAALLASLIVVWWGRAAGRGSLTIQGLAELGQKFFVAIVGTQLAVVMLAAPASAAATICLDKSRGTLAHMLMTDLSDAEIVLGKLAARLVPVLGLVLCMLPVMVLGSLLGGVDPEALFGALLVTLGCGVLGCSLALAFSVWATKTHEVMLATLAVWAFWVVALPGWWLLSMTGWLWAPPGWLGKANPFWVALGPVIEPKKISSVDQVVFLAGALILSVALTVLAVGTMRFAALGHANRPGRTKPKRTSRLSAWLQACAARLPGPSLDRNPVLWLEWHRKQPSRWARVVWSLYVCLAVLVIGIALIQALSVRRPQAEFIALLNGFQAATGLLLLSASASTSLAEDRNRGSLEVLLTTPLSTTEIVWGKWWGTFRLVPLLAILPALASGSLGVGDRFRLEEILAVSYLTVFGAVSAMVGLFLVRRLTLTGDIRLKHLVACSLLVTTCVYVERVLFNNSYHILVDGYCLSVLLVVGLVMAYGAALTSLGLALATWISRLGRAMALCVAAYVLMTIGWVFVVVSLFNQMGAGLAMGSPFFGVAFVSLGLGNQGPFRDGGLIGWALFWIVAYGAVALLLVLATIATFNRSLGRIEERKSRRFKRLEPNT